MRQRAVEQPAYDNSLHDARSTTAALDTRDSESWPIRDEGPARLVAHRRWRSCYRSRLPRPPSESGPAWWPSCCWRSPRCGVWIPAAVFLDTRGLRDSASAAASDCSPGLWWRAIACAATWRNDLSRHERATLASMRYVASTCRSATSRMASLRCSTISTGRLSPEWTTEALFFGFGHTLERARCHGRSGARSAPARPRRPGPMRNVTPLVPVAISPVGS